MSTIRVNNLEGLANVVTVPAGHNLEAYGNMVVSGQLVVPKWTEATKPTTGLLVGLIGYNTELQVSEIYTGAEVGWVAVGDAVVKSLESVVGVAPYLHYQSDDLADIAEGTSFTNGGQQWINRGSAGEGFNLTKDTNGNTGTNPQRSSLGGFPSVNFTGNAQMAFSGASTFYLETNNSNHNYTVAYVYGNGSGGQSSTSNPVFAGHCYGPSTNTPDAVGGGTVGWAFGYWRTWYDNDGANTYHPDSSGDSTANQYIWNYQNGQVKGYKGKSASPWVNQTHAQYGAQVPVNGIGHVRRHAGTYGWSCQGNVLDLALWTTPLNDTQVQALRDYYAEKYPTGNIAN